MMLVHPDGGEAAQASENAVAVLGDIMGRLDPARDAAEAGAELVEVVGKLSSPTLDKLGRTAQTMIQVGKLVIQLGRNELEERADNGEAEAAKVLGRSKQSVTGNPAIDGLLEALQELTGVEVHVLNMAGRGGVH